MHATVQSCATAKVVAPGRVSVQDLFHFVATSKHGTGSYPASCAWWTNQRQESTCGVPSMSQVVDKGIEPDVAMDP